MTCDDSTADPLSPSRARLALGLIVLIGVVLRLVGIDKSLYYDEMWATDLYVGEPFLLLRTIYRATQPPLYNIVMFAWTGLFGDSVVSVRTPSILFGAGTILLTYELARGFRGRSAGLVAAGLAALSPNAIWWSQAARQYAMGTCLAVLTVVVFHRTCRADSRRSIAGYALAVFAFAMSHYYAVAFMPWLFIAALTIPATRARKIALAATTALATAAPAGLFLARSAIGTMTVGKIYLRDFGLTEMRELLLWWTPVGSGVPTGEWFGANDAPRMVIEAVVAAAMVAGLHRAIRRPRPGAPSGWWLCAWLLCTPGLLFAISLTGNEHFYIERSALYAMPFVFAVLACGIAPRRNPLNPGTAIVAIALLYLTFVQLHRPPTDVDGRPLPNSRALAAFLDAEAEAEFDRRTVVTTVQLTLAHATPLAEESRLLESDDRELIRARAAVAKVLGDGAAGRRAGAAVEASFAELEAWKARRVAALRFPVVYGLEGEQLARQLERLARQDGAAYLVVRAGSPDDVLAGLGGDGVSVEEIRDVEGLRVWRIRALP